MTSWCDKLASTATIGFKLTPHVAPGEAYISAWSPLLNSLVSGETLKFDVEEPKALSWGFITDDGYKYGVDVSKVHVGFHHRIRAVPVSGAAPTMEMLSVPKPYSDLLEEATDRLIEATLLLPGVANRKVFRVGVMSLTNVDEKDFPPGIARFLSYLGRPWKTALEGFNISVTAPLRQDASGADRCIHQLVRPDDPTKLSIIQFDWQRDFNDGRPLTRDALKAVADEARKSALDYFEALAEGNIFDESLIS